MSTRRPALHALASRLGVVDAYHDLTGTRRETSDSTREALCAAMGHEAASEAAARHALQALAAADAARWIEPVEVWREHDGLAPTLLVRAPAVQEVEVELVTEQGERHVRPQRLPAAGRPGARVRVALPAHPGLGDHRVRLRAAEGSFEQRLLIAPRIAYSTREALAGERAFGVWTNLYTLRSERRGHAGIGDLADLAELARVVAGWGGDFVAISPLHAIPVHGHEVSPYGPTSRLYRSVLYLDVPGVAPAEGGLIDYDAVLARKLEAAWKRFDPRDPELARYCERQGDALRDFTTWEVLAEKHGTCDWRRWPARFHDARGEAVRVFREAHAREIDYRCWLQLELDRQLGEAARAAREAGMRVGLLGDLAIGCGPGSAETWAHPGLFARGVSVGAPPDAFAAEGQSWGIAPFDPHALRTDALGFFTRLVRQNLRHLGALRIDHVMGFERLFWIPEGRPPEEGAYLRYPRDLLLGALALESRRAQALIVGEDLGTVPAHLPRELASWALLSSAVLAFERERPPAQLSPRALASANTHDLAPLRGYVAGRDLALRHEAGALAEPGAYPAAQAARRAEVAAWGERLLEEGAVQQPLDSEPLAWCAATAAFLARSPAPMVAISLDDLAGEREPVHLPGIGADRHPGWRRRMGTTLEALAASSAVESALPVDMLRRGRARAAGG